MLMNIRHDVDWLLRASQPKLTALSERLSSASLNSCVHFPHSQLRSCRLARICENAAVSAECGIKDENPTGGMLKITALRRRHRTACMGHDLLNSAAESHLILTHHFRTPHHEHHWSSPLEMDTPASRADRRCSGSMGFAAVGRLLSSVATASDFGRRSPGSDAALGLIVEEPFSYERSPMIAAEQETGGHACLGAGAGHHTAGR